MPVAVLQLAVEDQSIAHPAAVPRKEPDVFCVPAIGKRIGAAARSHELFCSGINGRPLEPGGGKDLYGFTGACLVNRLQFSSLFPCGDLP